MNIILLFTSFSYIFHAKPIRRIYDCGKRILHTGVGYKHYGFLTQFSQPLPEFQGLLHPIKA